MTRTNIDYLFQITGAERAFTAPRGDERSPFGDHLSQASAGTAADPTNTSRRDDQRSASAPSQRSSSDSQSRSDQSASSESSSTRPAAEQSEDRDPPAAAAETKSETGTIDESASDSNEAAKAGEGQDKEQESDDEAAGLVEAAAAQAATQVKSAEVAVGEENQDAAVEAAGDEPADGEASEAQQSKARAGKASSDNAASAADVAESLDETSNAASEADAAAVATTTQSDANGSGRTPRRAGNAKATAEQDGGESQLNGTQSETATGEVQLVAEASSEAGVKAEEALAEPTANEGTERSTERANDAATNQTDAKPRNDTTAAANRIANAIVHATAAATNAATSSSEPDGTNAVGKTDAVKGDAASAATAKLNMQHAAGKRGAKTEGAEGGPRVDAARFVSRVAKAFQTAQDRGGTLQLRLNPPELGALRVELTVKDGVMSASLETENASARRVLLENLPALRERLAEQNIRVERFDVDVRRDGGGQQEAAQNQQQGEHHRHDHARRQTSGVPRSDETVRKERATAPPTISNTGINLVA